MTARDKLLIASKALSVEPPRGFHVTQDPETMDTTTLFVLVALGLILLWRETQGDNETAIDIGIHPIASQPPAPGPVEPPPVDPGPTGPPAGGEDQSGNPQIVADAIRDLLNAGRRIDGSCGAFAITNLVAWRLRPRYGLLRKAGGNRAVPQGDGSCLTGDESRDPGYATDYLIDRQTFFGWDILHDGGGANDPGWDGPESAPDIVQRNQGNIADPIDPLL